MVFGGRLFSAQRKKREKKSLLCHEPVHNISFDTRFLGDQLYVLTITLLTYDTEFGKSLKN